jgi:hypothetical protein
VSSKHPGFEPVDNEAFETRNVSAFPESDKAENTASAQAIEAHDDRRTRYENSNREDSDENRVRADRLKQLKLIQDAKVGSSNWGGQKITSIFARADNFLIYRIDGDRDDDSLRVFWSHTDDAKMQFMMTNYAAIQVQIIGDKQCPASAFDPAKPEPELAMFSHFRFVSSSPNSRVTTLA